jgi:hypothetical protein
MNDLYQKVIDRPKQQHSNRTMRGNERTGKQFADTITRCQRNDARGI